MSSPFDTIVWLAAMASLVVALWVFQGVLRAAINAQALSQVILKLLTQNELSRAMRLVQVVPFAPVAAGVRAMLERANRGDAPVADPESFLGGLRTHAGLSIESASQQLRAAFDPAFHDVLLSHRKRVPYGAGLVLLCAVPVALRIEATRSLTPIAIVGVSGVALALCAWRFARMKLEGDAVFESLRPTLAQWLVSPPARNA